MQNVNNEVAEELGFNEPEIAIEEEKPSKEKEIVVDKPVVAKAEPDHERTVPYGALHEERQRRKEMQSRIEKMEKMFQEAAERRRQPEVGAISQDAKFEEDPIAYLKNETEKTRAEIEKRDAIEKKRTESDNQMASLQRKYKESTEAFAKEKPDFSDSYNYTMRKLRENIQLLGYSGEEAERIAINEEIRIINQAYDEEVNPAEKIYKMAEAFGYKKEIAPEKKLQTVEKGIRQSKTLSGGGKQDFEITLENMLEMSDDEFKTAWGELERSSQRRKK